MFGAFIVVNGGYCGEESGTLCPEAVSHDAVGILI